MTNMTQSMADELDELLRAANPVLVDELPDSSSPAAEALYAQLVERLKMPASGRIRRSSPALSLLRRRRLVALAVAVAAVITLAVLPAQLAERGRVSIVERALAAVSTGPVLHAVLEVERTAVTLTGGRGPENLTVVDLTTGRERPMIYRLELWYDPARQLLRQTSGSEDTVVWEALFTADALQDGRGSRQTSGPPAIDPALAAFLTGYKQALESGAATVRGSEDVNGRSVRWLRFPPFDERGLPTEIAVDEETYEPVLLRTLCPRCTEPPPVFRVVALEGASEAAADFRPPTPRTSERVVAYKSERETVPVAEASAALGRTALWAGPEVAGIALSGMQLVIPSTHSAVPATEQNLIERGRGLQLYYGARLERGRFVADPREPHLTISQAADYRFIFGSFNFNNAEAGQPLTVGHSPVPREGEVALISMQEGFWTAQLRKDALYVEIDGPSRELVLEAARSLRSVP